MLTEKAGLRDCQTDLALDCAATPSEIEARSFAIIDSEIPEPRPYSGRLWSIARRCVHTTGDPAIVCDLRLYEDALDRGLRALESGCTIITDTTMAQCALPKRRFDPFGVRVKALMDLPKIADKAKKLGTTRARAGVLAVCEELENAIVVIGNAPTALLSLLSCLDKGAAVPALIVGMPVGFVNAAQSKLLLEKSLYPHFTLLGRKGGSAVAACCVNAMAELLCSA
ncbi:MAG: precorrin-8X methylmutase [Desulfovibrio sp.]|nr:precorrin-8X methylmutase [Desulfovibrio sp.]